MKKLVLAAAMLAGATIGLQSSSHAHGGQYRGPGDTVPPGGGGGGGGGAGPAAGPSGPSTPGPGGPTAPGPAAPGPGGAPGAAPVTTGGGAQSGPDLTLWSFWWEFNKEPYLNLKSQVWDAGQRTGSDGFFLGRGQKDEAKDSLRPTPQQIRQSVVPALLAALESETNNDIVTGCLIALAKIGDEDSESGESEFEGHISKWLADSNQEISETAAISLGILANPKSIETLRELMFDTAAGRKLVGRGEVHYRTRSFAAYGLGLIGARASSEDDRQRIVETLYNAIQDDNTSSRDLRAACVIAMGLVPLLEKIDSPAPEGLAKGEVAPPQNSRTAQLDYLLHFFGNEQMNFLVRAHAPTAMARLLQGLPAEQHGAYKEKIADALLAAIAKSSKQPREVQQSAILALGLVGSNDGKDKLDKEIRKTLSEIPKNVKDLQARYFSLIAMAKIGFAPGEESNEDGIKEASSYLTGQLAKGKQLAKPWAGLSCGVLGRGLADTTSGDPRIAELQSAVRDVLAGEKDNQKVGAYAIASGIMGDVEATETLLEKFNRLRADEARGYVAVGLGLMNAREAIEDIQKVVRESKYRPDLLKQAAISLGLLGDKALVPHLITMLSEAKSLATQAAVSTALGFIGDQRSIDPLVEMLGNEDITPTARGFAAVALGIVADKELLPWNTKIALDLNYRASTQTLTNQTTGTGILDIL